MNENQVVLTVKEASQIMRISPSAMYVMIRENRVPHIVVGKRKIIPANQFYAWLNSVVVGGNNAGIRR